MARKSNAKERNAQIREQQRALSEERRARSLKFEDFASEDPFLENDSDHITLEHIEAEPSYSFRSSSNRQASYQQTEEEDRKRPREKKAESKRRNHKKRDSHFTRASFLTQIKEAAEPVAERHESDFSMIACMICLCIIGIIMITSSSYYYAYNNLGDSYYFLKREILFLILGTIGLTAGALIPINLFRRFAMMIYAVSIVLLVAVLFVGVSGNGSTRWLAIGPIQFQPSEIAKLSVLLAVSQQASERKERIQEASTFFLLLLIIAVPAVLVAYQNLSSGLIIAFIGVAVMLVAGCRIRYFILVGIPVVCALAAALLIPLYVEVEDFPVFMQGFVEDFLYRSDRVKAWLHPFEYAQDEGYQIVQSLYAIASGGFFGQGLGESIQKLGFIPESYNDMVFSIICDELGLIGAALVIILFVILIWHGSRISVHAPTLFTSYLSAGLMVQIGIQAVLNIAVSTNSIPATGVSLPFVSYGGTSLIFLMISMGLMLNVSRFTAQQEEKSQSAVFTQAEA